MAFALAEVAPAGTVLVPLNVGLMEPLLTLVCPCWNICTIAVAGVPLAVLKNCRSLCQREPFSPCALPKTGNQTSFCVAPNCARTAPCGNCVVLAPRKKLPG